MTRPAPKTGLYYNRFRYYDPRTAQYTSRDPIGLAGGLCLHGYVSDPLGWIDPLGLAPITLWNDFQKAFAGKFTQAGRSEAATAWKVYKEAANSSELLAIGRLPDTAAAETLGMRRLNTTGWTLDVNRAWVQGGADANKPFHLATEPTPDNLFNKRGDPVPTTVFHDALQQLGRAGYTRDNAEMRPPSCP